MTTLHKITFESRNFLFEAYGTSSAAAHENLIEGLKEHARQAQIAEDWFREYEDDFNVETIDLSRPACMRDQYNLLKGCKATPKVAPVEPAGEQSYECKPAMLPVGFYWYFETDRQPVVVEKREPEDFVRFTNGAHQSWIRDGERFIGPISPAVGLRYQLQELTQLGRAMLGWIDAVPADVELPAMPGFDRDWAESLLAEPVHNPRKSDPTL